MNTMTQSKRNFKDSVILNKAVRNKDEYKTHETNTTVQNKHNYNCTKQTQL